MTQYDVRPGFNDMKAAADFMGPGAIETPMYQSEILDIVRRGGVLGQRIRYVPATGQPSRYFEQTRIVVGEFANPRQLEFNQSPDPTRRERVITLKAITAGIGFGIFDVEVTRQQGNFSQLVSKDLNDSVSGMVRARDFGLWNGTDTSLEVPTTLQYVGGLTQINRTASIASSASIIDGLKAEIAAMVNDPDFAVRPTAVYINSVLGDLIDKEERGNQRQIPQMVLNTVTGGLVVNALATQAGLIPLIADWALRNGPTGGSIFEAGKTDYYAVILTEALVEFHYVTSPEPRLFTLGLEGNLATRYLGVQFGAPVFKGKANPAQTQSQVETSATTYAHSVVTVVR